MVLLLRQSTLGWLRETDLLHKTKSKISLRHRALNAQSLNSWLKYKKSWKVIIAVCLTVWGWIRWGGRGSRVIPGVPLQRWGVETGNPRAGTQRGPSQALRTCGITTSDYMDAAKSLLSSHWKGRCWRRGWRGALEEGVKRDQKAAASEEG